MNFMQKCKRNGGFTLVELIVVIAILAILAGVAVPAYTGYIKKAEEAADQQLVGAVNTAFAAACLEQGKDANDVVAVSTGNLVNAADGKGKILPETFISALKIGADTVEGAKFEEAFDRYFVGNEASAFNVVSMLYFNAETHSFEGLDEAAAAEKQIENLKVLLGNSSYNGKLDIVTNQVSNLTDVLSTYMGTDFANLGGSGFGTYLGQMGLSDADTDTQAEAAILYLTQNASAMTEAQIGSVTETMNEWMAMLVLGESVDDMDYVNKMTEQTGSSLATYAAIYAVAEGIALQQGTDSEAYAALHNAELKNPQSVLAAMGAVIGSVENFDEDSTGSDLTAYFNALQTVNNNQAELEAVVKNGGSVMDSDVIQDLIAQMGK